MTAPLQHEKTFTKAEWAEVTEQWHEKDNAARDKYRTARRTKLYDFVFDR